LNAYATQNSSYDKRDIDGHGGSRIIFFSTSEGRDERYGVGQSKAKGEEVWHKKMQSGWED